MRSTLAIGYVALAAATIVAGVLLIEVVLTGSVLNWDNEVVDWLAEHRTPLGVDLSWVGSHLAETGTVLAIVAVVALILCLRRRFVAVVFFVSAIAVEAATYLATTLVIDRPRPHVVRLENLGSGASYPSGHTAAGVVIYVGIAMLVLCVREEPCCTRVRSRDRGDRRRWRSRSRECTGACIIRSM